MVPTIVNRRRQQQHLAAAKLTQLETSHDLAHNSLLLATLHCEELKATLSPPTDDATGAQMDNAAAAAAAAALVAAQAEKQAAGVIVADLVLKVQEAKKKH